jgi:hypothetical protein
MTVGCLVLRERNQPSSMFFMAANIHNLRLLQNSNADNPEEKKLHSIKQRMVYFNILILIFKIKNEMAPEYMNEGILYSINTTSRVLQNADDFRLSKYKKKST